MTAGDDGWSDAPLAEGGASLGGLVRVWRERALLTQEQLAERAGLSTRTVRRLESGEAARPRSSSLGLLAAALGLSEAEQAFLVAVAQGRPAGRDGEGSADPSMRTPGGGFSSAEAVPRQLPAMPPGFTGRAVELAVLGRVPDATAVVITAIDGMAGIGKTALAVQAAHRLAGRYPDGQLFIDLHGFTDGVARVEPAEALDRMLRALGVPGQQVPAHLDDRAALFRSRLADREIMVVLDNAADEAQVAPLLPGAPGCLVLITSRRRLAGLDHTHTVSLDVLPLRDAAAVLAETAGRRLGDEPPELVAEAVELCGRLPLAVRIAAARLRSRPAWTTSHLVERLRDHRRRLAELEVGPRSVTTALDLSYLELGAQLRRTYRLLGLHPGGELDGYAAAALIDCTLDEAEQSVDGLLAAHLLDEPTPGRFRFHDLVRHHATAKSILEDSEADRRAALTRLFDHYRHVASAAMDVSYPYERGRRPDVPPADAPCPVLRDETEATGWLDRELPNLLAAATHAADHGWPDHILQLSAVLFRHLRTRGRYSDAEVLHNQALTTARKVGDRRGEAEALVALGHADQRQGRLEPARRHFRLGLTAARASGHRQVEVDALTYLGQMDRFESNYEPAAAYYEQARQIACTTGNRHAEVETLIGLGWVRLSRDHEVGGEFARALELARAVGHRVGEGVALASLGHAHQLQGRYEPAIDAFEQALHIARAVGNRDGELAALTSLANALRIIGSSQRAADIYQHVLGLARHVNSPVFQLNAMQGMGRLLHATGRSEQALTHHQQALELAVDLRQPLAQAQAHDGLAHAHSALGHPDRARQHWTHALDIFTSLAIDQPTDGDVSTASIRAHLDQLDRAAEARG